jgi:hypothetical protein
MPTTASVIVQAGEQVCNTSDLARTNLPRMALIELIIISFMAASKKAFVARKLTVVIHPKDLDTIDFSILENFLQSTCF